MTKSTTTDRVQQAGLETRGLSVRYGGRDAVSDVTLNAARGEITGLIGPNGAGKTSIFNACNGLLRPRTGSVHLCGVDITGTSAADRARRGLGRTFQRPQIVNSMTVRTNISLGAEARLAGSNPFRQLVARRGDHRTIDEATRAAIAACGISDLADRTAGTLSTGQRRLLELARVLAGGFEFLLLDEPSSGLDQEETACFGEVLKQVVAERGVGILLVEHDMRLVMAVCTYLYVLEFGTLIFRGTAAETQASEAVRSAYLGESADAVAST